LRKEEEYPLADRVEAVWLGALAPVAIPPFVAEFKSAGFFEEELEEEEVEVVEVVEVVVLVVVVVEEVEDVEEEEEEEEEAKV